MQARRSRNLFLFSILSTSLIFFSTSAYAAKLKSYCILSEQGEIIKGTEIDLRLPIASVSKLFTTYLAVSQNELQSRVATRFYYWPAEDNPASSSAHPNEKKYDVHIAGDLDPFFGRPALQWLIAKLNEVGVYRIRHLTFDQNFKYYHDINSIDRIAGVVVNPVSGKESISAPSPEQVRLQLLENKKVLLNYKFTVNAAKSRGVSLPGSLIFQPEKISSVSSAEFHPLEKMSRGEVTSPELMHLLKLMNWKSNNHAANQIFNRSGGASAFDEVFYRKMGLQPTEARFINGSGQNANLTGDGRDYNEATCRAVVKVIRELKSHLELKGAKLQNVASVVGGDIGSTVGGTPYSNSITSGSVIAKTGTIGTNVTLGGMVSAIKGVFFFFYNVELDAPPSKKNRATVVRLAEAQRARKLIAQTLTRHIQTELGGPARFNYATRIFNPDIFADAETPESLSAKASFNGATAPLINDKIATEEGIPLSLTSGALDENEILIESLGD